MTIQLREPSRLDEPCELQEYLDVISRVAAGRELVIVRRDGEDVAAIVPLECLAMIREAIAREELERLTKTIDWKALAKTSPPPQAWFDRDEPKPF